jgi:hypothetical protein
MAIGLLTQPVHAVTKRVTVDTELVSRLAPAAAGIEERGQGLDERGVLRSIAEDAVNESLEGCVGQAEQELEGPEISIRGDVFVRGVERSSGLDEAAAERAPSCRAADGHAGKWFRLRDPAGERERLSFAPRADEERRTVPT